MRIDPLKTYDENKQALDSGSAGASPVLLGSGASGGGGSVSADSGFIPGGDAGGTSMGVASAGTPGVTPSAGLSSGLQGSLADRLVRPIQQGADTARQGLTNLNQLFQQDAGASRNFEGVQGQLDAGIASGATGGQTDAARNLVNAQYLGPQGLDPAGTSRLYGAIEQGKTQGRALGSIGGLQTAISQAVPGLTPGEARFESQLVSRDIGFQDRANEERQQLAATASRLRQAQTSTEDFARQRAGEEASIARQSRDYLTDQGASTMAALNSLVTQRQEEQDAARGAYDRFQSDEIDFNDLIATPNLRYRNAFGEDITPEDFTGRYRDKTVEAQAALADLFERYPQYAGGDVQVGLGRGGRYGTFGRGGESTPFDSDFYSTKTQQGEDTRDSEFLAELLGRFGPGGLPFPGGETVGQYANLLPLFSESGTEVPVTPGWEQGSQTPRARGGWTKGELIAASLLHDGGGGRRPTGEDFELDPFEPIQFDEDYRPDVGFEQGIRPTTGNQMTPEQRDRYNAIQGLLGSSSRFDEPLVDYQGSRLVGDIQNIERKEEEAYMERKALVDQQRKYLQDLDLHLNQGRYEFNRPPPANFFLNAAFPGGAPEVPGRIHPVPGQAEPEFLDRGTRIERSRTPTRRSINPRNRTVRTV